MNHVEDLYAFWSAEKFFPVQFGLGRFESCGPDLLLTSALYVLGLNFDSTGGVEVNAAARTFKELGGGFCSQKSDCLGGATQAARNANDAWAYFALPFYAVPRIRAVQEVLSHFGRPVVHGVQKPVDLDIPSGPVSF